MQDADYEDVGTSTSTSYEDTGLTADTDYYYKLSACLDTSKVFCSDLSTASDSITTLMPVALPEPSSPDPGSIVITNNENNIQISWTAVQDADNYKVYRSTDNTVYGELMNEDDDSSDTSYTDTTADPDTLYYYKVIACNNADVCSDLDATNPNTFTLVLIPSVPTIRLIEAGNVMHTSLVLSWDSVEGADIYYVYRSDTEDGTYTLIEKQNQTSGFSLTQTNLDQGTAYYYKIRGCATDTNTDAATDDVDDANCSELSSYALGITTLPLRELASVSSTDASITPDISLNVVWNVDAIYTSYEIWRARVEGATTPTAADSEFVGSTTTSPYKDNNLEPNTEYSYFLRSCSDHICSDHSTGVSAKTKLATPAAVRVDTRIGMSSLVVYWDEHPDSDVMSYKLARGEVAALLDSMEFSRSMDTEQDRVCNTPDRTCTYSNLQAGSPYIFSIQVCADVLGTEQCSDFSPAPATLETSYRPLATANTDTITVPNKLDKPTISAASDPYSPYNALNISWIASDPAPDYYNLYLAGTPDNIFVSRLNSAATSYIHEGLTPGENYSYKIEACFISTNGVGVCSPLSDASTIVQTSILAAPTNLSVLLDPNRNTSVHLAWSPVEDANYYQVYAGSSATDNSNFEFVINTVSTEHIDFYVLPVPATARYYNVRACSSTIAHCSPWSPIVGIARSADLLITEFRSNNASDTDAECNSFDGTTTTACISNFIEISNLTGQAIDLSDYVLLYSQDGSSGDWVTTDTEVCTDTTLINNVPTSTCNRLKLSGMLNHHDSIIVSRPNHDTNKFTANFIWDDFTADGNDGVALAKLKDDGLNCPPGDTIENTYTPFVGSTTTEAEVRCIIDTVGEPYGGASTNANPSAAWKVAGIPGATRMVIRRKASVARGNINWTESRGTDASDSEWIVIDADDFNNVSKNTNIPDPVTNVLTFFDNPDATTPTTINLKWTADAPGFIYYNIYRSDLVVTGPYIQINAERIDTNTYTDTGLTPDTRYLYSIEICNPAGCSPRSDPLTRGTASSSP